MVHGTESFGSIWCKKKCYPKFVVQTRALEKQKGSWSAGWNSNLWIAEDQQAALFGQACFSPGEAEVHFGTGSFILLNTGNVPVKTKSGVLTTVAWQLEEQKELTYALEEELLSVVRGSVAKRWFTLLNLRQRWNR